MNAAALHLLARHLRALALQSSGIEGEATPSLSELVIVEDVAHHPGTPIGEIARRVGLAQSLVSKTVAELREAAILTSQPDVTDGRRVLVSLVPETLESVLKPRGKRPIETAVAQAYPALNAAQRGRVQELLEELAALMLDPSDS